MSTDGASAKLLWDDIRCPERSKEREAVVQDQHEAGQAVLWSRGLPEASENPKAASLVLSGEQGQGAKYQQIGGGGGTLLAKCLICIHLLLGRFNHCGEISGHPIKLHQTHSIKTI